MPRPNQPRSLVEEANLARRIAFERERRGWSYEGLAKRMTDAGCPINASGLYKVEKGEPPRRITVAELVALSRVFDIPIDDLLLPPEVEGSRELADLFIAWNEARDALATAEAQSAEAWASLQGYVADHPELGDALERIVGVWAQFQWPETDTDEAKSYWMWKITDSRTWKRRALKDIRRGGGN